MRPEKRKPSTSPEKPEAKRVDDKASPHRQEMQEQQVVDNTSKPVSSDIKEVLKQTEDVKEFCSQLFGREVGSNKYPSIKIDDQEDTYQVKVHRPKIVGEFIEQMRDITPVMFIKTALANKIKDTSVGKDYLINNFIEYILAVSKQIGGTNLTKAQYQEYKKQKTPQENLFKIKFTKQEENNTKVVKYLMDNREEYSKLTNFDADDAAESHTTYLQKYIKGVLNGLRIMFDNDQTLKTACEFIAKFITSIIDPEGELIQKDSILFKEVRLYKRATDAEDADGTQYDILSNQDIVQQIPNDRFGTAKSPFIRIINKKGEIIKHAVKALTIIDLLVGDLASHLIDDKKTTELFTEYDNNYNFYMKKLVSGEHRRNLDDYVQYREKLTKENLYEIFHYHVAKQLYSMCDFRSLGQKEKMLAPAQEGDADNDILRVYTSATGKTIEQYSCQDKLNIEPTQLGKQAISFVSVMLSPFSSLRSHVSLEEKEELSPIKKIFKAVCNLLRTDYSNVLDQQWSSTIQEQFDTKIINSLNEADLLGNNDVQYDLDF